MSAARPHPLIAAVRNADPALVILPGMLAVTLASLGQDGYRLPEPIKSYSASVSVVKATATRNLDAQAPSRGERASEKMDEARWRAFLQSGRRSATDPSVPDPGQRLRDRIRRRSSCRSSRVLPSASSASLTALLASFMSAWPAT